MITKRGNEPVVNDFLFDDDSPATDFDSEVETIRKIQKQLSNKTNAARDSLIQQLQNGKGDKIKYVLSHKDQYNKIVRLPFYKRWWHSISNFIEALTRIL